MMNSYGNNLHTLCVNAIALDKKCNMPIEKSLIRFTIYDYFLRNDVELHGDGATLANYFFGENNMKTIQIEMTKRKIRNTKPNK